MRWDIIYRDERWDNEIAILKRTTTVTTDLLPQCVHSLVGYYNHSETSDKRTSRTSLGLKCSLSYFADRFLNPERLQRTKWLVPKCPLFGGSIIL